MTEIPVIDKPKTIQDLPIVKGMEWGRAYIVTREQISGPWVHHKKGVNLYVAFDKDNNVLEMWRLK